MERSGKCSGENAVPASVTPRGLTSLTDGIVVRDVGRRFDSKESREEVEVDLLDGSSVLSKSVNDGVGAALLDGPSDEREREEVKGVWPAKAPSALAPAIFGEVDAGGAPNDEHQGVLGELSAQGPESERYRGGGPKRRTQHVCMEGPRAALPCPPST